MSKKQPDRTPWHILGKLLKINNKVRNSKKQLEKRYIILKEATKD